MKGVAGAVNYYQNFKNSDHCANTAKEPGGWLGKGAELLNLKGEVTREAFGYLLDGFSPDGKRKLVENAGTTKTHKGPQDPRVQKGSRKR
jgi:conjugative relaxase-like TrwC/TraI family protein